MTDMPENRWAVILAGGEGVRLRSLTRAVTGDDRPKQFCALLGGKTLLAHTRERTAHGISPDRTLFVLMKAHERFYAGELAGVPSARMVVQPCNRGTLPAILHALLRIGRDDPAAVVAFFPSDHHYANARNFMASVDLAFGSAETGMDSIILLGAPATHSETDYGWIEAEAALSPGAQRTPARKALRGETVETGCRRPFESRLRLEYFCHGGAGRDIPERDSFNSGRIVAIVRISARAVRAGLRYDGNRSHD